MSLLLGIDLGTSYFKVGLFDATGALKGLGRVAVDADQLEDGRVELPVPAFWERLRRGLSEALAQAGAGPDQISGVSYSSQANTFLLLDAADRELTPLVFWTDQRVRPLGPELAVFGGTSVFARTTGMTGLVPECAPAKCLWFARNEPAVWSRARRVMTVSDYLVFGLTGERVGDASTAVLTGVYDLSARSWWPEGLERFGMNPDSLSTPLTPGKPCGVTSARAVELLGLPRGIPFAVGALDHHAAALGAGLGMLADASLSTGTVLAALMLTDRVNPEPGCIHGPHLDARRYYRLTFDANGAGQLEAFQRRHAPELSIEELVRLAEGAASGPGADAHELGSAVNDLLRSIALSHGRLLNQVAQTQTVRKVTATGGGARSPYWLQLTADILGIPVVAVASPERACLGAAMFAAAAAGLWPDVPVAAEHMVSASREYVPRQP
jgi:sugar (pentulose or hexulose) kinase